MEGEEVTCDDVETTCETTGGRLGVLFCVLCNH